ncbi:MAG: hypothetical protein PUH70_12620 [Clostridiales bacterium]|nr:hypothetical protein [Clostridiales bacterium]MDY5349854.1 hypothetical protein [Candidatus Ventricola sp.]MDY5513546.1 hypothetical protein [Candidatus Ventricola sp.]
MFRQEEVFVGGWKEKTLESMQRRRFEQRIAQLAPLGAVRLEALPPAALARKLEQSWQDIERKPMRSQQLAEVWRAVLSTISRQADCLSREEHDLVERALVLGGSAPIEDPTELEAARALSLRLWACVGLVSGKPYIELEAPVLQPVARAFAREEHEAIRRRFEALEGYLSSTLYRVGAMDDRQPQQLILSEVLGSGADDELAMQLARRYLWASFDCVDYSGGVMLVHPALADPHHVIAARCRRSSLLLPPAGQTALLMDILPEEIPLQADLERVIEGGLRAGLQATEVARTLRFLCKQGAPLPAMEEVLQASLIVYISPAMRGALANMYYMMPKWIECAEHGALQ